MTYLTSPRLPLPTTRHTYSVPAIGDPPLLATAVEWPIFHLAVLPGEWPLYALIELAAEQAERNRLVTYLLMDADSALVYYGTNRVKVVRVERCDMPVVTDRLPLVRELPIRPQDLERMSGLARVLRDREPERLPSELLGGHEASPEEIEELSGTSWDGLPKGLERCAECGEPRGGCLRVHRGRTLRVEVDCRCAGLSACGRCLLPLHPRPLRGHWWDEAAGELRYVPGFVALEHRCG